MKFDKKKITNMDGKPEVHLMPEGQIGFTLVATVRGIRFDGRSSWIDNLDDLRTFANIVGVAWEEHEKLKPKLSLTPAGH